MGYSNYAFSAATHADFYRAEAELLRFSERIKNRPYARYMKKTLLAMDAVFAIRMAQEVEIPIVPLVVLFELTDSKYHGDVDLGLQDMQSKAPLSDDIIDAVREALHYMQALEWVAEIAKPHYTVTIDTVLRLHEILLNGKTCGSRYHGFRSEHLPHMKGSDPQLIALEVNELCNFSNCDYFSPLGQASVIHHAFERIVPFDDMVDRTGLLMAFIPMFRRGLFANGYMAPICWGASLDREYRKKLKDVSRIEPTTKAHLYYRERWAVYNARNTRWAVIIAESFLNKTDELSAVWRSQGLKIPANSAIDRLLDVFLAIPRLTIRHAASIIGKSYGATSEAMGQLKKAGIVQEQALDNRERAYRCEQSRIMITEFVNEIIQIGQEAEERGL